jgi:hypothetical protein
MNGLTCKSCARLKECIKAGNDAGCEHNDNFEGEKYCRTFKRNTNADRIRAMSDEELADMLASVYIQDYWEHPDEIQDWLKQPVREDA